MFELLLFIILWIYFPFLWISLLRAARISLKKISIPSILIIFIIIYQYAGIPLLYFKIDKYRVDEVVNSYLMLKLFFLTSLVITLLIVGYVIARFTIGSNFQTKKLSRYYDRTEMPSSRELQLGIFFTILGIFVLTLYVNKIGLNNIAFLNYFKVSASDEDAMVLRSNMGNAFEGHYYIYKFFMRDLLVVGSMTIFSIYLLKRSKVIMLFLLVSCFACTLSFLIASEKEPIVMYIIGLGFSYILVVRNGFYSVRHVLLILFILSPVISFAYILFMGAQSLYEGLLQGVSRGLTGQIQPLYHYLEIFPAVENYLFGRSMPNPLNIFPFEYYNLTVEVMNIMQPWHLKMNVIGTMPTFFWGELYANFSYFGVLLFPPLVGFAVCWVADIIDRIRPTPVVIAITIWFSMHIKDLAITSFSNYLIDFYSVAMFVVLFLAVTYSGSGHFYYRSSCHSR